MSLTEAPFSKDCDAPASVCEAADCDCSKCDTVNKERNRRDLKKLSQLLMTFESLNKH